MYNVKKEKHKNKSVKELFKNKFNEDRELLEKSIAEFIGASISAIIMVQIFIFVYAYFF